MVVAGCVLVAAANGHIDSSEKNKITGFIQKSFDRSERQIVSEICRELGLAPGEFQV